MIVSISAAQSSCQCGERPGQSPLLFQAFLRPCSETAQASLQGAVCHSGLTTQICVAMYLKKCLSVPLLHGGGKGVFPSLLQFGFGLANEYYKLGLTLLKISTICNFFLSGHSNLVASFLKDVAFSKINLISHCFLPALDPSTQGQLWAQENEAVALNVRHLTMAKELRRAPALPMPKCWKTRLAAAEECVIADVSESATGSLSLSIL